MDTIYATDRSDVIFVKMISDDYKRFERYRRIIKMGTITLIGSLGSHKGDIRNEVNLARGAYEYCMEDTEAYIFCKKITPYLFKHDQWRWHWCQVCRMEYMSNENNQHRQA